MSSSRARKKRRAPLLTGPVILLLVLGSLVQGQDQPSRQAKITVDAGKPAHSISPALFGIFFEDINLSSDGGIYPDEGNQ